MAITVEEFENLQVGDTVLWMNNTSGRVVGVLKNSEGQTRAVDILWSEWGLHSTEPECITSDRVRTVNWVRAALSKSEIEAAGDSIWDRNKKLLEAASGRWRAEAVETPECWKKNPFLFEEKPYKPEVSLGNRVDRLEREIFSMYGVQFKEMKKDLGCLWFMVLFLTLSALGSWFLTYHVVTDGIREEKAIYEAISINYEDIKALEREAEEEQEQP